MGGKCKLCGYSKCYKALQFHHNDPKQKDFTIGSKMRRLCIDKFKKELDKCTLLCANCHSEVHDEKFSVNASVRS
jgi:hypothetical protein